jgi:hypothetical protein
MVRVEVMELPRLTVPLDGLIAILKSPGAAAVMLMMVVPEVDEA